MMTLWLVTIRPSPVFKGRKTSLLAQGDLLEFTSRNRKIICKSVSLSGSLNTKRCGNVKRNWHVCVICKERKNVVIQIELLTPALTESNSLWGHNVFFPLWRNTFLWWFFFSSFLVEKKNVIFDLVHARFYASLGLMHLGCGMPDTELHRLQFNSWC